MNALCNLSRKRPRLSRRCFTLCITVEVELELRSSTNANTVAVAEITVERGWRVDKNSVFASFFMAADQNIASS